MTDRIAAITFLEIWNAVLAKDKQFFVNNFDAILKVRNNENIIKYASLYEYEICEPGFGNVINGGNALHACIIGRFNEIIPLFLPTDLLFESDKNGSTVMHHSSYINEEAGLIIMDYLKKQKLLRKLSLSSSPSATMPPSSETKEILRKYNSNNMTALLFSLQERKFELIRLLLPYEWDLAGGVNNRNILHHCVSMFFQDLLKLKTHARFYRRLHDGTFLDNDYLPLGANIVENGGWKHHYVRSPNGNALDASSFQILDENSNANLPFEEYMHLKKALSLKYSFKRDEIITTENGKDFYPHPIYDIESYQKTTSKTLFNNSVAIKTSDNLKSTLAVEDARISLLRCSSEKKKDAEEAIEEETIAVVYPEVVYYYPETVIRPHISKKSQDNFIDIVKTMSYVLTFIKKECSYSVIKELLTEMNESSFDPFSLVIYYYGIVTTAIQSLKNGLSIIVDLRAMEDTKFNIDTQPSNRTIVLYLLQAKSALEKVFDMFFSFVKKNVHNYDYSDVIEQCYQFGAVLNFSKKFKFAMGKYCHKYMTDDPNESNLGRYIQHLNTLPPVRLFCTYYLHLARYVLDSFVESNEELRITTHSVIRNSETPQCNLSQSIFRMLPEFKRLYNEIDVLDISDSDNLVFRYRYASYF